jgi:DNA-binding transcriptional MerR regulator
MDNTISMQSQPMYSIHEVADRSGLSIPTIRYYEDMGLVPGVQRDASSRHRRYDEATLQLLESLANLRAVGMSLVEMRDYLTLRAGGSETAAAKRDLFQAHAEVIRQRIARLHVHERYLSFKVAYWDAKARGDDAEAAHIAQEYESLVQALREAQEEA